MNGPKLELEFNRIKQTHKKALRHRAARVVLGSSVVRVFRAGTKGKLLPLLSVIKIDSFKRLRHQADFKLWFEKALSKLASAIKACNHNNSRIQPGYKWGHAAKVLTLYIREIVLNSRYFSDHEVRRIQKWLYVPIDGILIRRLQKLDVTLAFDRIKEIDTAEKFFWIQEQLEIAAKKTGVPKVWFDDNWGDRQ